MGVDRLLEMENKFEYGFVDVGSVLYWMGLRCVGEGWSLSSRIVI